MMRIIYYDCTLPVSHFTPTEQMSLVIFYIYFPYPQPLY